MKKLDYFQTIKGQKYLLHNRKYKKLYFSIDAIPKSKNGISKNEEIEFQEIIVKSLLNYNRRAYRSPIVLEIDFYSSKNNPPAIHTLAKCYLDLLEDKKAKTSGNRNKLIYKNDKQVKALFINYHINNEESEIKIKVDSLSNFISDLSLYNRIKNNDFLPYEDVAYPYHDEFEYEIDQNTNSAFLDNPIEEMMDFVEKKEFFNNVVGENAYSAWLDMYEKEAQRDILINNDLSLDELYTLLCLPNILEDSNTILKPIRSLILNQSSWLSLDLGEIPKITGDTKKFKKYVKQKLKEVKVAYPKFFIPLKTLLSVTIILIKPKVNVIDLDNLARKIMPFIHEIIKPPSTYLDTIDIDAINDDEIKQKFIKDKQDRPKIPKYSIIKYQIFEIPNIDGNDEGTVKLFLGDGMSLDNLWDKLKNVIDKWDEATSF